MPSGKPRAWANDGRSFQGSGFQAYMRELMAESARYFQFICGFVTTRQTDDRFPTAKVSIAPQKKQARGPQPWNGRNQLPAAYPESLAFGVRPSLAAETSPAAGAFLRPRAGALRHSHPPAQRLRRWLTFGAAYLTSQATIAFCTCSRFSAWSKMVRACASKVSSSISLPR